MSIAAGLAVVMAALLLATVASAQTSQQPIALGDNKPGQITAADPAPAFVFNATAGQSVTVLVLSLTPGFAPAIRVVDPSGAVAQEQQNPSAANSVQAAVTASQTGSYQFIVQTANGTGGQFVISVQAAAAAPPAQLTSIPLDTPITSSVDATTTTRSFAFNADPAQPLTLRVTSVSVAGGPSVTLADGTTGEVLGSSGPRLLETSFRIPPGAGIYQVQIDYGNSSPFEQFIIALESSNGVSSGPTSEPSIPPPSAPTVTLAPLDATATDVLIALPVIGPCVIASAGADRVNIRSGPGTGYSIITQITLVQIIPVTGRLGDNTWFQVSVSGLIGWVSTSVVRLGGDCGGVPIIALPTSTPEPSATYTVPPPPTETPTITLTPSITPTFHLPVITLQVRPSLQFVGTLPHFFIATATPTPKFHLINPGQIQPISPIQIVTPHP